MNSLKCQLQRGLKRWIVFKDIVGFLRPVDLSTENVPAETASVAYALRFSQEGFAASQLLLCFLALINIRIRSKPFDDFSQLVPERDGTAQAPAI